MRREKDLPRLARTATRSLQVCAIAAFLACLMMLIWRLVPVFAEAASLDLGALGRRVLVPMALIILNTAGVVLTASVVAAMFAQASWRDGRMALGPLFAGVLLFGAEAMLIWRISVATIERSDPALWIFAGMTVSFLSTWLLLEPLLRLPREVSDAARLDGLGFGGFYRHVLLPRMKRRLPVASLLPFGAGLAYVVALSPLAAGQISR